MIFVVMDLHEVTNYLLYLDIYKGWYIKYMYVHC